MLSHLKRRIGVLTAVTVLAALVPVMSSSTVSAAPLTTAANPTNSSTYSACPSSANIPSAGFTDTTSTDVDCIAYYGITTGVTATTYEPAASVPRWQMALYLTRTATETGHTLGSGADQGFTDISGYAADIQTAINQLKQLTVTLGTTATTYSPDDNVTREQMAMFVERLLGLTAVGPNTAAVSSAAALTTNIGTLETQNAYNYTDIDGGGVTFEGHEAIEELYNLGVPGDTLAATTFSPAADITRADMATWLTNALGHTNLRPAGINIQLSANSGWANTAPTISVSYRDANFDAVAGQLVDAFYWKTSTTAGNTSYVDSDGECKTTTVSGAAAALTGALTKCYMDVGDPTTDAKGNIAYGAATVANGSYPTTLWAWTAASGTTYDSDTDYGTDVSSTVATSTAQATTLVVSCDVNAYAIDVADEAPFEDITQVAHGTTVTITIQMSAAAASGTYAAVAQPDNNITLVHTIAQSGDGVVAFASVTSNVLTSDASGTATYSFTQADPNNAGVGQDYNEAGDEVNHMVVITDYAVQGTSGVQTPKTGVSVADTPCWGDDAASGISFKFSDYVPAAGAGLVTATPSQNVISYEAAATAAAPVARTATVTARDKFGNVVPSATGGANFYGSAADVLAAQGTLDANDLQTGADVSAKWPVGTGVCFGTVNNAATAVVGISPGVVYYIQALSGGDANVTLAATAGGAALTITGASAVTDFLATAHPTMGCAQRAFGPTGTAAVAWNDTNTGTGMDQIWTSTTAGESTTTAGGAGTYAFRWLDPSTTALASTTQTTNNWTENEQSGAGSTVNWNHAEDLAGKVLILDAANNTMLVDICYGAGGTCAAASHTYVQYSYDSNDYFFLCSHQGVPAAGFKGTTDAGFEGYYGPYGCTYGLNSLKAGNASGDGWTEVAGVAWSSGSIDSVAYAPLAANISVFKTGHGNTG